MPEDDSAIGQLAASLSGNASDGQARAPDPSGAPSDQPGPVPWVQAIGAATGFVAVGLGLVYGLGAIAIALRLWYVKDLVTPVVGQLPSNFLLVDAFSRLILPAIVVGAAAYFLFEFLVKASWRRALTANNGHARRRLFIILLCAALLSLDPIWLLRRYDAVGVIRSYWEIYGLCTGLSILSFYLALRVLALVREREQRAASVPGSAWARQRSVAPSKTARAAVRVGIASLALAPWVTFTFAAIASFPPVYLCGPTFSHVDSHGRHFAEGNLIGVSDQWAYVAETKINPAGTFYKGSYIAVIPLSEVQLQAIGTAGECNDIAVPSRPAR